MGPVRPFRVLTLDGGGIRGLYTAALLKNLADHVFRGTPLDIGKGFDLIAGTSTGGILACALAKGIPLEEIISFYQEHGPLIFPRPKPSGLKLWLWVLRHICKPSADASALKSKLEDVFGQATLEQVYKDRRIALCIPSVHATSFESKVFKTPHNPYLTTDRNYKLSEVCMATSAAPIFFPIADLKNAHNPGTNAYIDGGLWANNPVLIGLIEALHILGEEDRPIEIFSVGTCSPISGDDVAKCNRGLWNWEFGVGPLNISIDAQVSGHDFMANHIARYLKAEVSIIRLPCSPPSPLESKHLSLDNASKKAVETLLHRGKHDADMIIGKYVAKDQKMKRFFKVFDSMKLKKEK